MLKLSISEEITGDHRITACAQLEGTHKLRFKTVFEMFSMSLMFRKEQFRLTAGASTPISARRDHCLTVQLFSKCFFPLTGGDQGSGGPEDVESRGF